MISNRLCLSAMIAVCASVAFASVVQARPLEGDEIREKVAGKRVFLSVPMGGEFPLYYQTSGRVDGSGEAQGLGRFLKPTDSGRWWITENRLCQQWTTWYDGKQFCFRISHRGGDRIEWVRDDGYSGTARIGR